MYGSNTESKLFSSNQLGIMQQSDPNSNMVFMFDVYVGTSVFSSDEILSLVLNNTGNSLEDAIKLGRWEVKT